MEIYVYVIPYEAVRRNFCTFPEQNNTIIMKSHKS